MKKEDIDRFIERNLKNFSVNSTGWEGIIRQMLFEFAIGGWNLEKDVFGKEDFGELCCNIYSEDKNLNTTLQKITDKYSELSQRTCEICGSEGKMRTVDSWQTTLCLNHFLDQKSVIEIDEELNVKYKKKTILNIKDLAKAEAESDLQELKLYTKESANTSEPFSFSWHEPNYYLLLKTLPLDLFQQDIQNEISDLFQSLENCEICGYKALHHKYCLRCGNEPWGASQFHRDDYEGETDYIKTCQIDAFIDENDYEKYFKYDRSFEKVPDHKILFTSDDLEEYE
ncbi:hypothetical protein [Chryseobacterium sp.]|uniref:hypothetical protein n=1 Tax=Chryseobacterium sp. TaxID=1871047 RepID=UPI00289901CB|nr:hypothetical protein [Chryseobacterium sp.]